MSSVTSLQKVRPPPKSLLFAYRDWGSRGFPRGSKYLQGKPPRRLGLPPDGMISEHSNLRLLNIEVLLQRLPVLISRCRLGDTSQMPIVAGSVTNQHGTKQNHSWRGLHLEAGFS